MSISASLLPTVLACLARYTTKDDDQYIRSENHPELTNSHYQITTNASLAIRTNDLAGTYFNAVAVNKRENA